MTDDRVMALCELSGDLLFHKIPRGQLPVYVDGALAMGREAAAEYKGRDMLEVYKEAGIAVVYLDESKSSFGVVYRGQAVLDKKGCSVELFRASIRELAENSAGGGLPPLSYETALQVHLAHEFFHFLEFQQGETVAERLPSIVSMQLLSLKRHSRINRASEVAAHAFAKEVTGLAALPNAYDYMYMLQTGRMKPEAFAAKQQEMEALLHSAA